MLRVSVMLHPANGGPPREIAAAAIAQRGRGPDDQRRYLAMTTTDGLDGDVPRAALVEHHRSDGVWELVRAVLAAADVDTVDQLVPVLRDALERRLDGWTDAADRPGHQAQP